MHLVRFARGMALFATAAGVRYCWRNEDLGDYDAWREIVLAHGGAIARATRRAGRRRGRGRRAAGVVRRRHRRVISRHRRAPSEVAAVRRSTCASTTCPAAGSTRPAPTCPPSCPPPGQVVTSSTTPTTLPPPTSNWGKISALFQGCLGVCNARDRVFGAAGQKPDYQVTSPIFRATPSGGSTSPRRPSTTRRPRWSTATCRDVRAALRLLLRRGQRGDDPHARQRKVPAVAPGSTWHPVTFVRGLGARRRDRWSTCRG